MLQNFKFFKNKKVLITGHTGFKGSWLCLWLSLYGAKIVGISNKVITKPSNFLVNSINLKCKNYYFDISDKAKLKKVILSERPDIIFHLAAQSIVSRSYKDPYKTWITNLVGSLNLFEILRIYKKNCTAIIITSDKCYKNIEKRSGYNENDILGGDDQYSASKAGIEISFKSYFTSFFTNKKNIKICTVRAGNVIGGGDWAEDRLVPDAVKKWSKNQKILIRNPNSTRPWQHVFEALYGYCLLVIKLQNNKKLNGQSFNFGPGKSKNYKVINILDLMKKNWKKAKWKCENNNTFKETSILNLNCQKVNRFLKWKCLLSFNQTIFFITQWYKTFYENKKNIKKLSIIQLREYEKIISKS